MSRRKPTTSSRNLNAAKPPTARRHSQQAHGTSSGREHGPEAAKVKPKTQRRTRKLVRNSILLMFALSSIGVGGTWIAHISFFRVQHSTVVGAVHEDAAKVLRQSGLLAHPTMLGLTDHAVLANLGQFAWVTGVQVQRHWPNSVVLRIYETHAVAVAYNPQNQLEYVGAEGQDLGAAPLNANLPTLSMVVPAKKWPYTKVGLGAVSVAQAIPKTFGSQISMISEEPNGTIRVGLTTPVTFILGPAVDLEKKFVAMASVISNYTLSPGETIDVTIPGEIAVTPTKG